MTSILVLFVVGLNGSGPQVLAITDPMPKTMCMSIGQPMAAKWLGEHPKLKLTRFACVDPKHIAAVLGKNSA
jgi:hypothetical protein